MIELMYTPLIGSLGMVIGLVPIAFLAALAVLDLRAVMLVRALSLLKRRARPGQTHLSGDEWAPAES